MVWDALIRKTKVLAGVEMACAGKDKETPSEGITDHMKAVHGF